MDGFGNQDIRVIEGDMMEILIIGLCLMDFWEIRVYQC